MYRMMQRLDVDVRELADSDKGRDLAVAAAECANCENAIDCELWLETPPRRDALPMFCANLKLFDLFIHPRD